MDHVVARRMWSCAEPLHAVAYFAPDSRDRFEQAGVRGFWRAYFAGRAAPLGPSGPHVVHAVFQSFTLEMVERAVPGVWELVSPDEAWRIRSTGCGDSLRSVDGLPTTDVADLVATLRTVCDRLDPIGRAFFATHLGIDWPDDPHEALWHACTLLREHRGDGYVTACVVHDMTALDMMILAERIGTVPSGHAAVNRGWSDDAIDAQADSLRSRGLLDASGSPTARAQARRIEIEGLTDRLAAGAWYRLDSAELRSVHARLAAVAAGVAARGWISYPNPVGVEPPTGLGRPDADGITPER